MVLYSGTRKSQFHFTEIMSESKFQVSMSLPISTQYLTKSLIPFGGSLNLENYTFARDLYRIFKPDRKERCRDARLRRADEATHPDSEPFTYDVRYTGLG